MLLQKIGKVLSRKAKPKVDFNTSPLKNNIKIFCTVKRISSLIFCQAVRKLSIKKKLNLVSPSHIFFFGKMRKTSTFTRTLPEWSVLLHFPYTMEAREEGDWDEGRSKKSSLSSPFFGISSCILVRIGSTQDGQSWISFFLYKQCQVTVGQYLFMKLSGCLYIITQPMFKF